MVRDGNGIDLNCDMGEGLGNEALLMPFIASCNVACGGHAGDLDSMRYVVGLAKRYGVRVGAHPSYPDNKNFGRTSLSMTTANLTSALRGQIGAFLDICKEAEYPCTHIKPHGALYNDLGKDGHLGKVFLEAMEPYRDTLKLFLLCGSPLVNVAKGLGYEVWEEAFADRNYTSEGRLVSRKEKNALITQPEHVFAHLYGMIRDKAVLSVAGERFPINAQTFCIHGDTPNALEIVTYLQTALAQQNIKIK